MGRKSNFRHTTTIRIRSLYPAELHITGSSGASYCFPRPGSELDVLEEDAQRFLQLVQRGGSCCGGNPNGPSKLFESI